MLGFDLIIYVPGSIHSIYDNEKLKIFTCLCVIVRLYDCAWVDIVACLDMYTGSKKLLKIESQSGVSMV